MPGSVSARVIRARECPASRCAKIHTTGLVSGSGSSFQGRDRMLAAPVPRGLDAALAARGVTFQRGEALLACDRADEPEMLEVVASLKADADIVLRGPVIADRERVHPRRWQLWLGTTASGTPIVISASQLNVLTTSTTQRGQVLRRRADRRTADRAGLLRRCGCAATRARRCW